MTVLIKSYEGKCKKMKEKTGGAPSFHMEIVGARTRTFLQILGVRHIEDFASERVVLRVGRGRVYVFGSALGIAVFENKTVEIEGRILEVKFSYDRS